MTGLPPGRRVPPAIERLARDEVRRAQRLDRRGVGHQRKAGHEQKADRLRARLHLPFAHVANCQSGVAKCQEAAARKPKMSHALFGLLPPEARAHRQSRLDAAWRKPEPKPAYDVIIIGGGHGLATAYYLAKQHGITNVAVLEKSYLGSGNIGRNTTIIRSNYLLPGNTAFYEHSMKLWEGLSQELNFNTMVSQRGILNVFHSDAQRNAYVRRGNAMRLCRCRCRAADARPGARISALRRFRQCPVPDSWRADAAARRHGAPRRRGLGLCPRRR